MFRFFFLFVEREISKCFGDQPEFAKCLGSLLQEPVQGISPHCVFCDLASVDAQVTNLLAFFRDWCLKGVGGGMFRT